MPAAGITSPGEVGTGAQESTRVPPSAPRASQGTLLASAMGILGSLGEHLTCSLPWDWLPWLCAPAPDVFLVFLPPTSSDFAFQGVASVFLSLLPRLPHVASLLCSSGASASRQIHVPGMWAEVHGESRGPKGG